MDVADSETVSLRQVAAQHFAVKSCGSFLHSLGTVIESLRTQVTAGGRN